MKTITTYNHIGGKIIINGREHVSAPATIILCLVIDVFIILLLDPDELKADANIYCYDIQGNLLWIVKPFVWNDRSYFTSIYVMNDLNFYAYSIIGVEAKIDYKTGEILSSELIK